MNCNILTVVLACTLGVVMAASGGCHRTDEPKAESKKASGEEDKHGHEAHHGGCLNAIELCSVGHAEVKLEDGVLRCWFVGGENETDKSVRVPDEEIRLTVRLDGGEEKPLVLAAKPIDLAGEKVGDCSYFEGAADWLKNVKRFVATGTVHCKGKERPIRIEYPDGYDPDDQPDASAGGGH
jgi:hypothetical protein